MAQDDVTLILSAEQKPFPDFNSASLMRDHLNAGNLHYQFVVVEHPEGGFAIERRLRDRTQTTQYSPQSIALPQSKGDPLKDVSPETLEFVRLLPIVLRPALRNYFPTWIVVALLFLIAVNVEHILLSYVPRSWLHQIVGFVPNIDSILFWGFIGLAVFQVMTVLKDVYSNEYTISKDHVQSRFGLVSRDTHTIKFRDIRGVALEQSVFERLIGVGTLEFYTAGSSGADVVFRKVAKPTELRDYLDEYATAFSSND